VAATANETGSPSGGFTALSNGASHHVAFGDLIASDANSHQYSIGLASSATWAGIGTSFRPATPHASTVDVTVTNPSGTSATGSGDQFTYAVVPGAPTGVSATALQASSTTVSWTAPASNGGAPITSYTVVTVQGGTTVTVSAPNSSATVTNLTDASYYQFVVYATNVIGTGPASSPSNSIGPGSPIGLQPGAEGYRFVESKGGVDAFGDEGFYGSMGGQNLNAPISGIADTPSSQGYWEVGQDGGVFAFGNANFYGSLPTISAPIIGIAATPDGGGYWLVGSDGHIYAYGDANYDGAPNCTNPPSCTNSFPIGSAIVAIVATPSGSGYWEADSDGDVYAFGNAVYQGSSGCVNPNLQCGGSNSFTVTDITAMAANGIDNGYWLVGADGGVFGFGNAAFLGSSGNIPIGDIIGVAKSGDGNGYWLLGTDGAIYGYGDAGYVGSMAIPGVSLGAPNDVVGIGSP
jgi:Fibronectin type III domain